MNERDQATKWKKSTAHCVRSTSSPKICKTSKKEINFSYHIYRQHYSVVYVRHLTNIWLRIDVQFIDREGFFFILVSYRRNASLFIDQVSLRCDSPYRIQWSDNHSMAKHTKNVTSLQFAREKCGVVSFICLQLKLWIRRRRGKRNGCPTTFNSASHGTSNFYCDERNTLKRKCSLADWHWRHSVFK